MSIRAGLRSIAESARRITGPLGLDVRTNQLTIRTRTWSGSYIGEGTATNVDTVLPAHYPIRHMTQAEIAGSGGAYETGDVLVDHITPSNGVVGFTTEQLDPTVTGQNREVIYVISGEHPGEYSLVACRTFRVTTYQLVLRRTRATP